MASGVAESLPILAAIAPGPGSTVPISKPHRRVTDSKTVNSHRFRRAIPLNSRRSILMTSNPRSSVLLQTPRFVHKQRPDVPSTEIVTLLTTAKWQLALFSLDRGQTTRAYGLRILPLKPFGTTRSHEPAWLRALVANHPSALTYAAICFDSGVVRISIRRGKAAAATGAVISSTPF